MAVTKLIVFFFFNLVALASSQQSLFPWSILETKNFNHIQGPNEINFGSWGEWERCPAGKVVTGFQLKVEPKDILIDDTGLNGIGLFCGNPVKHSNKAVYRPAYSEIFRPNITSSVGEFGLWTQVHNCNTHAVGFNLQVVPYRGSHLDDEGATNMKLICADGEEIEGYKNNGNQHAFEGAIYTGKQVCQRGYAVCGIQTQVEEYQFAGDDTTLNNVKMECCPLL